MIPAEENIHRKIQTLIQLIDDPDETVYSEVKQQLLLLGPVALPYLEQVWNDTINSWLSQRIEDIITDIQYNELTHHLIQWKYHQQEDLLYAVWLINHFQYPEVSLETLQKKIDTIKKDVWIEFAEDLTAIEEVQIINHILFEVHQYAPNITNYYSMQNNYLHYVLENKRGNNITLGILYLLIAQKLKIPIYAVNIPDYLILCYLNENMNLYDARSQSVQDAILFYINPFSKGILLQKEDIIEFLHQINTKEKEEYFIPCSHIEVIERLLLSIAQSYVQQGNSTMYSRYKKIAQQLKEK